MKIILASASPRRQMLLEQIGVPFGVVVDETLEDMSPEAPPYELVRTNSIKKAMNVRDRVDEPSIIIAADTVVSLNGSTMGKPVDESEAKCMLRRLSGQRHTVYTGVCLVFHGTSAVESHPEPSQIDFVETADVFIRKLTEVEIESYVKTGEPMDKAGAYAIQGKGSVFVERIEGDYYTVMGLPLARLYTELKNICPKEASIVDFWQAM